MLQTQTDPNDRLTADRRGAANGATDAPPGRTRRDADILALLCPDWRDAMFVLDVETLAVAYANSRAVNMFKRRYPLVASRGRLEVASHRGTEWLRAALQRVLDNDTGWTSIIVDDEGRGLTYRIRICRPQGFLRDVLYRNLEDGAGLVVLEVTSGRMTLSRSDIDALGAAFGLTSAETAILALLGQGCSLLEIAALRGVGLETVRHQCKQLLSKTRSRRQSDLVKLVVTLCNHDAPFAADQDQSHA